MAAPPATPDRVGPYLVRAELGRGAMGVVYLATAPSGEDVALKVLLGGDAEDILRFRREAELAGRLRDPGIVAPLDVGVHSGFCYYAMELCEGEDLRQRLRRGPLSIPEAVDLVGRVARTLARAHAAGIIHRDLKPENILLDGERPRVTDFGLAKEVGQGDSLTASGTVLGTPAYMAPEQLNDSKRVGPPGDVYALGVILFECLTGRRPYTETSLIALSLRVLEGNPPLPSSLAPGVPQALDALCAAAMAADPALRPSAEAFADALEAGALEAGALEAPRPRRAALLATALVVACVGAGVGLASRPASEPPTASPTALASESPTASRPPDQNRDRRARQLLERAQALGSRTKPWSELLALLEQAQPLATDPGLIRRLRDERLDLLLRRGQYTAALKASAGLPDQPSTRRARLLRANALRWEERGPEAFALLERLGREDPDDPDCLVARAVHSAWADHKHQPELLRRALELAPDHVYGGIARVYYLAADQRDVVGAQRILSDLLERAPDHGLLLWAQFELVSTRGHLRGAERAMSRLILGGEPTPHFEALAGRATVRLALKALEEALRDAERASLRSSNHAYAVMIQALCEWQLERASRAKALIRRCYFEQPRRFHSAIRARLPKDFGAAVFRILLSSLAFKPGAPLSPTKQRHLTDRTRALPRPAQPAALAALQQAARGAPWKGIAPRCAELLAQAPSSIAAARLRLELLLGRDRFGEARLELARARTLERARADDLDLILRESTLELRLGRSAAAKAAWRRLIELDPRGPYGTWAQLRLELDASHPTPAIRARAKALLRRETTFQPGRILAALEAAPASKTPHQTIRRLEPILTRQGALSGPLIVARANVIAALRHTLEGANSWNQTALELDQALAISDSAFSVMFTLSWVLNRKVPQSYPWCERILREALRREPDRGELHAFAGYLALAREERAATVLSHWRRARALAPDKGLDPAWVERFETRFGADHPGLKSLR